MKTNTIYYLKKNQKLLCTSKKTNTRAVIDVIDKFTVKGHYIDLKENELWKTFYCCPHEFHKIFSSKPQKI